MMQLHSPSSRPLAVPAIGFPQDLSSGANVIDLAAFRRARNPDVVTAPRPRDDVVRADDQDHLPPHLIAFFTVGIISLAAVVGPLLAWLLSRVAVLAS